MGLSEINSKNYRIILDNVNKSNSTPVKQPVDPTITDLSYDSNSIVKTIKQQQKHEFSKKEIEGIIAAYQSGASTYELAKQYNCHRSTISHQLKLHDIEVQPDVLIQLLHQYILNLKSHMQHGFHPF